MRLKAALFIFAVTLVVYSNSLGGEFVYDDEYFVVKNISIRNISNIPFFFTDPSAVAFSELNRDVYRPVTAISYAIDYLFWKLDSFPYHLTNVLLHSANAALVFLLFYLAFGNAFISIISAVLFALHPVNTEVVSWISGRSSVLFLFFYLLAMLSYIYYMKRRKPAFYLAALASFALSLFSKEMAVSFPVVVIIYDALFCGNASLIRRLARVSPFFVLTGLFVIARSVVIGRVSQCDWWGGSPYHTFLSMIPVIIGYLKLLFAPVELCAFYTSKVYTSIAHTEVLLSLVVIFVLAAAIPALFKRSKIALFGMCWFFVTLLPVSNIIPLRALIAERFLYLPSIGFSLVLACLLSGLRKRHAQIAFVIASLLIAFYCARTMIRNEDWKDVSSISASILKVEPLNSWAYSSQGNAYVARGRYEEGIKAFRKAMAISPGYPSPRSSIGFAYLEMGRFEDAAYYLETAYSLDPKNLEVINSLGVAYANLKRYDKAIALFQRSIELDPTFLHSYLNLGAAYEHMGEYEKALTQYEKISLVTRSRQDIAISYVRIGDLYVKMKLLGKAKEFYRKAIETCSKDFNELKDVAKARLDANWK